MVVSMFLLKPKYRDNSNYEIINMSKNVFLSTIIIQLVKVGVSGFTIYDFLSAISFSIITVVFYKIFSSSILALQKSSDNRAFSIEELIGASLLCAIAVSAIGDIQIFGFSIRNIINIFIVLALGWKNGVLIGTTAGVTIGVTVGVISASDPIMIAAYAISGMIAGVLNKFGKVGVIVGFCLGNIVLAYVSNGYTVELIHFKEIIIASVGLLVLPKSVKLNIEDFIGNKKMLPAIPELALSRSKETAEKLNNVSETIKKMAEKYNKSEKNEEKLKDIKTNKDIFFNELLDNLRGYENNILYEDIANVQGCIDEEIFIFLIDKQEISREQLLKIFAKCNSFIIDEKDQNISGNLNNDIEQMIRVINMSYKISKSSFIWQMKLDQNKKNMQNQLKSVSKVISNLAEDIEKKVISVQSFEKEEKEILEGLKQNDIEVNEIVINKRGRFFIDIFMNKSNNTNVKLIENMLSKKLKEKIVFNIDNSLGNRLSFISDDKYIIAMGTKEITKNKSEVSGDSILNIRLKDGKYLVALSDGMGTGKRAKESSEKALKMLENLLLSGFDKKTSIELINSGLSENDDEIFSTLDIAIIDLYEGNIEFLKSGACPTYIKSGNRIQLIKSTSLPAGVIDKQMLQSFDVDINEKDIVLMCTDGILDSNVEYKNKELWVKYLLEDIETTNTSKIAEIVTNEAIDNNFGIAKDDMSVVVYKFIKK